MFNQEKGKTNAWAEKLRNDDVMLQTDPSWLVRLVVPNFCPRK